MIKELSDLIQGYQSFRKKYFEDNSALYEDLVKHGQNPKILVVACSDSRVDPAIVLNCQPGELFVVRNVANLIPPFEADNAFHGTSAAIEFAVRQLEVAHVIVLGHSQCGGIGHLFTSIPDERPEMSFIQKWMKLAQGPQEAVLRDHVHLPLPEKINTCSQLALKNSVNNLLTFPWIAERVQEQLLSLHGWYFELHSGVLFALNPTTQQFEAIH